MYCPDCGAETTPGLNYCKRCGANLAQRGGPEFPVLLTVVFLALILIIMTIGLALPFVALPDLVVRGVSVRELRPLMVLSPMVALGASGLLVWLLLKLIEINRGRRAADDARRQVTWRPAPAQVEAPPRPVTSVTDRATGAFDIVEAARESRASRVRPTR